MFAYVEVEPLKSLEPLRIATEDVLKVLVDTVGDTSLVIAATL
jgi:hypothetical protein